MRRWLAETRRRYRLARGFAELGTGKSCNGRVASLRFARHHGPMKLSAGEPIDVRERLA